MTTHQDFMDNGHYCPVVLNYRIQLSSDSQGVYFGNDEEQNDEIIQSVINEFSSWLKYHLSGIQSLHSLEDLEILQKAFNPNKTHKEINFVI
jgi:hypothetical protein